MSFAAPRGVVAPILTPFNDDLTIATDLYVELARRLFDEGCAGPHDSSSVAPSRHVRPYATRSRCG